MMSYKTIYMMVNSMFGCLQEGALSDTLLHRYPR